MFEHKRKGIWMDGRTDGGILIDAPRRSDHTQNYVIYSQWTAVDTKQFSYLLQSVQCWQYAIRSRVDCYRYVIFQQSRYEEQIRTACQDEGNVRWLYRGERDEERGRGISLLLSVQRSKVECSELLVSTGTRHDLPIQPSQCISRVSKNIPYLNSNVSLQLSF
jgi:hypothetical protein